MAPSRRAIGIESQGAGYFVCLLAFQRVAIRL